MLRRIPRSPTTTSSFTVVYIECSGVYGDIAVVKAASDRSIGGGSIRRKIGQKEMKYADLNRDRKRGLRQGLRRPQGNRGRGPVILFIPEK